MKFEVHNDRVLIHEADTLFLRKLNEALSYPTEVALALQKGIRLPNTRPGWDGMMRLLRQPKKSLPNFPTGLLSRATDLANELNAHFELDDTRQRPDSAPINAHISLYDYQDQAITQAIDDGRGVVVLPPRSGKTRIACGIIDRLGLNTIYVAPTRSIVDQTAHVMREFFGKGVHVQRGKKGLKEAAEAKIVICTGQTLGMMTPAFLKSRDVIIVDEFHHAASKTWVKIAKTIGDNIFYRFGLTGTFFRSGHDEMAMHAWLSNVIFSLTSDDMMERGRLTPVNVAFVPNLAEPIEPPPGASYQEGIGKLGICENESRNAIAAVTAARMSLEGETVLILVSELNQGKLIIQNLTSFIDPKTVKFIHGKVPSDERKEILDAFVPGGAVKVVVGTSCLYEGVDMPGCSALVYCVGEKASVQQVQAAYRVATKSTGKEQAYIIDFNDTVHDVLREHTWERCQTYMGDAIFDVKVLENPFEDFDAWLSKGRAA